MPRTADQRGDLIIGMMSGTSADGVDAVLVDFSSVDEFSVLENYFFPLPASMREDINGISQSPGNTKQASRLYQSSLHQALAQVYAKSAQALLKKANRQATEVRALANHGQTVAHHPNANPPLSIQLGDPTMIANLTGITTIANFRQADLLAGGQGAPLMPAFHQVLLNRHSDAYNSAILNLGGIANLTLFTPSAEKSLTGFDCGPANTLLNQWINKHKGRPYDANGTWAASGKVNQALLDYCLNDTYFRQAPPKSTGPDYFNLKWLNGFNDLKNIATADVQATLLEVSAKSIIDALLNYGTSVSSLYVCGGGIHNTALVQRLQSLAPTLNINSTQLLGVDPDWMEAIGFAWLGYCKLNQLKSNLPTVTGARHSVVLGSIYQPT